MRKSRLRARKRGIAIQKLSLWRMQRVRPSRRTPPESIRETKTAELLRNYRHLDIWPSSTSRDKTDGYIEVPTVFSFIDNPNQTLSVLNKLKDTLSNQRVDTVFFDHSKCEHLDLCASVVMDVLALRARIWRKKKGRQLTLSGAYSKTPEVNVLLRAIGILSTLEHSHSNLPDDLASRFELFKLRIGHKTRPSRTTMAERFAGELADFFDKCLQKHGFQLLEDRARNLKHLIGEVLDNAEQHARIDPYWHLIGFYRQSEAGSPKGDCHIVIFNFGDSIDASLERKDASKELKSKVAAMAMFHQNKNHFGQRKDGSGRWEKSDMVTQLALQEGVSRRWNSEDGSDRGNGTVKMIEFFGSLTGEDRKMTLISGSTKINFSSLYSMENQIVNEEERKVIAFNKTNSLFEIPDPDSVEHLESHFPGMLVSLRFDINESDLRTKLEVICERPNDN